MIKSPCIGVCTLIQDRDICSGCGRTTSEIAQWGSMSALEKRHVNENAEKRLRWFKPKETK
jgi:hypothetical protein